jgi:pantoate kinase
LLLKRAKAFSPAGISSFFEICDRTPDGKLITDPERVGARGGGFSPDVGVLTEVSATEADNKEVSVFINGELCSSAETTQHVVDMLTANVSETYSVSVSHYVEVPVGAGFGSSAAGALGVALALSKVLGLNLTYNQLGKIAHVAEVKAKTGLGTVGPLLFGGCGLTIEPGAPGIARLDRIPVSPDHRLIIGTFRPYPTKEMLSFPEKRELINRCGRKTLASILAEPSLENFMASCKRFALETDFATPRVQQLMADCVKAGAVGAAQNMLGEAVHALVYVDAVDAVYSVFKKFLPEQNILVSRIDVHGARMVK